MAEKLEMDRFDRLLTAMSLGEEKPVAADQTSDAASCEDYSDTQTRPDTSANASGKPKRASRKSPV